MGFAFVLYVYFFSFFVILYLRVCLFEFYQYALLFAISLWIRVWKSSLCFRILFTHIYVHEGREGSSEVNTDYVDKVADFSDPASMDSGVFDGCTHVMHLAAQGSPAAPFEDILTSNIISTYHAYEAAKRSGVKRFVLASTNHVQHGSSKAVDGGPGSIDASRLGGRQMTLSDPPTPDSYYAASKLLNEDMGKLYSRIWNNFEVVSLRIG